MILCLSATWLFHAGFNLTFLLADTTVPDWQDRLPHLQRVYDGLLFLRLHGLAVASSTPLPSPRRSGPRSSTGPALCSGTWSIRPSSR